MSLQEARETTKELIRSLFKNDYDKPFEATDTQADAFNVIWLRKYPRNVFLTYTQFGKTDITSMALLLRSQVFKESWTIVAGKKSKGMLIMKKVIQHTFDNPRFYKKLEMDPDMPLEELRRSRSKENITWLGGGGVRVLSANTSNRNQIKEALIGEGGQNIIEEEAPHIPDDVHAMIMRMLMGHQDNFLLKIGNAFGRNHYFKSVHSDKYHKIIADYHVGIAEGRITMEQIDEVRDLPFFHELYDCIFPDEDDFIMGNYRKMISDELLENAFISEEEFKAMCTVEITNKFGQKMMVPEGNPRLGSDIGGGGDRSAHVIRWPKVMKLLDVNKTKDTMQQVPIVENNLDTYNIEDADAAIDYGGLGQGAGDRLHELERYVNLVMFGASAPDIVEADGKNAKNKYKNMRAYMYYQFLKWLKEGGKIVKDDRFYEFGVINYKEDSERKFQIQPKEELKKLLKELNKQATSPDVPDASVLTFADNTEEIGEDDYGFI